MTTKTFRVETLARVEGEGSLYIDIEDGVLTDVRLKIFEPPRFFEAFMVGRDFMEAPDITARICGICPVAYQMSSIHAMEGALGTSVTGPLRELRRLLYCGEWIESHVLHMFMLHLPDFLGYESAIHLAKDFPNEVKAALELKKLGNRIVQVLGGREIHPINVRVGGFYKIPDRAALASLLEDMKRARDMSIEATRFCAGLPFPDFERDYCFVSLHHPDEYPFNEGRLISSRGLDLDVADYEDHFHEHHVSHSNALHSTLDGETYFLGPLARTALCYDQLSPLTKQVAEEIGWVRGCTNPFKSILARGLETVYACDEAIRILTELEPTAPFVPLKRKAGRGQAVTEAPRGFLYHRYTLDEDGKITSAKIVPPTSQNQRVIEEDLRAYIEANLDLEDEKLQWQCEQTIRNYDPCISCATHFLKLHVNRR